MSRVSLLMLVALGCSGKDSSSDPDHEHPDPTDPSDPTQLPEGPTWYGEVEPVVRENCVSCHQEGGIGTFRLDDYETAKAWASAMALAVTERTMPPWLLTDDGTCGDFANSRWLDDEDIELINAWAEAGAPEGDPALAVSDPLPALPSLDRVDAVLTTPTFVPEPDGTPYAMYDEYRCFLLQKPLERDTFLTGFEVVPGNEAIVHHVLAMPVDLAAPGYDGVPNGQQIQQMDAADDRLGWDCYGTAGGSVAVKGVPVVWAPGMGAVELPDGIGLPLSQQDAVVIQVHYNMADPDTLGQSDSTEIYIRTSDEVQRIAYLSLPDSFLASLFYGNPEVIPPGEPAFTYTSAYAAPEVLAQAGVPQEQWFQPFDLVSVMPHMHGLGKQERLEILRGGTEAPECLADVQRWDFEWQLWYTFQQPITVQPDDLLQVSCTWDSSALSEPTLPGWGTENEMCLVSMMVVPH